MNQSLPTQTNNIVAKRRICQLTITLQMGQKIPKMVQKGSMLWVHWKLYFLVKNKAHSTSGWNQLTWTYDQLSHSSEERIKTQNQNINYSKKPDAWVSCIPHITLLVSSTMNSELDSSGVWLALVLWLAVQVRYNNMMEIVWTCELWTHLTLSLAGVLVLTVLTVMGVVGCSGVHHFCKYCIHPSLAKH